MAKELLNWKALATTSEASEMDELNTSRGLEIKAVVEGDKSGRGSGGRKGICGGHDAIERVLEIR